MHPYLYHVVHTKTKCAIASFDTEEQAWQYIYDVWMRGTILRPDSFTVMERAYDEGSGERISTDGGNHRLPLLF